MRHSAIDIDVLQFLVKVAETGKLSRAARILHVETSTLSRKISAVEDELGVTLFERGSFGIRMTAAGRAVMPFVRRLLADLEALRNSSFSNGAGHVGEVRIGVRMPPVGEPGQSLLRAWRKEYPNVDLTFFESNEHEIMTAITERRLDAAFMTRHTLWSGWEAVPIWRERLLVALPTHHPKAVRRSLKWDLLRNETFLVQGWDDSQTAREFFASFLGSGVKYKSHSVSKDSILAFVGAGHGVTLVTKSQSQVKFPGVVYRPIAEDNAWVEVDLAWERENKDAVVGRFISFMRDQSASRRLL
jgi:DNA-binding transcriptional LysR family regulator